jgi:hypothetical protein
MVNESQAGEIDPQAPIASVWVCHREECQERARSWVQGVTGEPAVFVPREPRS